jgi:hypothetical protein
MYGGLLKTASAAAILAAAGLFGASSAKAADLGGDCCADLEERVAELEATTVRKGNRKVSVTLSGFVAHNVMYWDDGGVSDTYIGDGGNYGSRFRFVGSAKISPTLSAGFLYEFGVANNSISSMNQGNGGDDLGGVAVPGILRDSTVWLRHSQLGMLKVGHGSTATDNLILIDLGGMGGAGTSDVALYNGGFFTRFGTGALGSGTETWGTLINGGTTFDTARRNHVLYETPALAGFTVQAAVGEDNYWDVALRYAGEFSGFRLAFGIGYQEDTEFNGAVNPAVVCTTDCNRKEKEIKGSASILHVASGLFVTAAGGKRDTDDRLVGAVNTDFDASFWYVAAGVRKNFFGFGDTVLFGEYSEHKDFVKAVNAGLSSDVTHWGIGVNQYIDAAAMEVFLVYKNFSADLSAGGQDIQDFNTVIGGARVNF